MIDDPPAPQTSAVPEGERPNGRTVMAWGGALLGLVPLLVFAGLLAGAHARIYPDDVTPASPWRLIFFVMAGMAANIGVLLLLAGYIVRAIAFLPGRGDAFEAQMKTSYSSEPGQFAPREQR